MEDELKKVIFDKKELVIVYQKYHTLIVNHSKQPFGNGCFLNTIL